MLPEPISVTLQVIDALEQVGAAYVIGGSLASTIYLATPEDTILAKLEWYRLGDEVSDRQWRDILGVLAVQGDRLDLAYMRQWAATLGVSDLLEQALREVHCAA
jgi:hypothetical protein